MKIMIIPKKLKKGDVVAIVSLSSGMGGDKLFMHRYELGKKRLEEEFGLKVITMPNALKGSEYLNKHPEARAKEKYIIEGFIEYIAKPFNRDQIKDKLDKIFQTHL